MMTRLCLIGVVACFASVAWAQPALPAPAAATPPPAAATPAAPTAPAAPAATPTETAATTDATPAPAAPAAAPARSEDEIFRARLALERERLRLMLARARMSRPMPETRPEEDPVVYGDAGAPFAIGVSLEQLWYVDESYDVFAKDNVTPRFGAWASYDLLSLRPSVILAGELGWGYESEEKAHPFGGQLDTTLRTHTFDGGVRVRWVPIDFFQPHIRVAGGIGWVRANLSIVNGDVDSKSDELLPFASAGLGFLLRTPTRSFENNRGNLASLSFGVMFEAGYTQAMGLDVAFHAGRDKRAVALTEPNLGTLERSGPYLRTSFVVGF